MVVNVILFFLVALNETINVNIIILVRRTVTDKGLFSSEINNLSKQWAFFRSWDDFREVQY